MTRVQTLPDEQEVALAKLSSQTLTALLESKGGVREINVVSKNGEVHHVKLPTSALTLMVEILTQLGQGNSVSITPIHAELTTQEAADLLNMSRPTFIKLLDSGELPYSRTGNRRKVAFSDVMSYKQNIDAKRLAALDELSALDQELGLSN